MAADLPMLRRSGPGQGEGQAARNTSRTPARPEARGLPTTTEHHFPRRHRGKCGERTGSAPQVLEYGVRRRRHTEPAAPAGECQRQLSHVVRVRDVRWRANEQAVHQREHGRVGPDPRGQGDDGGRGPAGSPANAPQRVPHVGAECHASSSLESGPIREGMTKAGKGSRPRLALAVRNRAHPVRGKGRAHLILAQ